MQNENLYLGFGSIQQVIDDKSLWGPLTRLADYHSDPRTDSEAAEFLVLRCGPAPSRVTEAVDILRDGHYLLDHRSYRAGERYSRPSLFYALSGADSTDVQQRLRFAHVVFVGCGGIGNLMSAPLATAGVGRLTLRRAPGRIRSPPVIEPADRRLDA